MKSLHSAQNLKKRVNSTEWESKSLQNPTISGSPLYLWLLHLLSSPLTLSNLWPPSVQFSRSVVSNSLRPHESQHARPPCPSPMPGVALEMNRDISLVFEMASKYGISDSFVDRDGYSISSKGFLSTVIDIMVIWVNSFIPVHFSSLIPRMSTFTLAISCLTTSNLPWFMDLTFQVPMRYCSLQHWTLLLSPVTSTTGYCFCFGSIPSFFLELFLHWSPVAYWAPTDLESSSFTIL